MKHPFKGVTGSVWGLYSHLQVFKELSYMESDVKQTIAK